MKFLERMNDGKNYEKLIEAQLIRLGLTFRKQVEFQTSFGVYRADFVLSNGLIIESTKADLSKCRKHPFISKKISKLREMSDHVVIISPFADQWEKETNCRSVYDGELAERRLQRS